MATSVFYFQTEDETVPMVQWFDELHWKAQFEAGPKRHTFKQKR